MKKVFFLFFISLLSAAIVFAQAKTDVTVRSGRQASGLRIVFESGEEFIKKANVSTSGAKINIEFPSAFNLIPQKALEFETSVKDRVLTISVKELSETKVMRLAAPPRLVIDIVPSSPSDIPKPQQEVNISQKVFVLDPGHGGYDFGITGNEMKEKDITLSIAKEIDGLLAKKDRKVFLTRRSDQFIQLKDRALFANQKSPEIFVSIHVSTDENFVLYVPKVPQVNGEESVADAFGPGSRQKKYIQKSKALADSIGRAFKEEFNLNVIQREMFLPVINYANAPAVLIEIPSFKIMSYDQKTRTRLAEAIIKGFSYYGQ